MPRIDLPAPEIDAIAHFIAAVNRGEDVTAQTTPSTATAVASQPE